MFDQCKSMILCMMIRLFFLSHTCMYVPLSGASALERVGYKLGVGPDPTGSDPEIGSENFSVRIHRRSQNQPLKGSIVLHFQFRRISLKVQFKTRYRVRQHTNESSYNPIFNDIYFSNTHCSYGW